MSKSFISLLFVIGWLSLLAEVKQPAAQRILGYWVEAETGDYAVEYRSDGTAISYYIDPDTTTHLVYHYQVDDASLLLINDYQTHDIVELTDSTLVTEYHMGITETGDTVYGDFQIVLKRSVDYQPINNTYDK
ncbi:MAG: hypothetical protein LIO90_11025 [Bacteroidales bacterium]|nr:hypothetical protein [Bacteroidales bacterium]